MNEKLVACFGSHIKHVNNILSCQKSLIMVELKVGGTCSMTYGA